MDERVKPRMPDPEAYEKWEAVPVFDNQEGYPLPRLKQIADNSNSRFTRSGDLGVLTIGHTEGDDDDKPEVLKHPVVGFAAHYRTGKLGQKDVLLADLFVRKEHAELAKDFPRRSCELWYPDEKRAFIDCVALLGKTAPARDLSLFFHREGEPRRFEFREADHPRADDGKFGSGGGGKAPGKGKEPPKGSQPAKAPPKGKEPPEGSKPAKSPPKGKEPQPKDAAAHAEANEKKADGVLKRLRAAAAKVPGVQAAGKGAKKVASAVFGKIERRYGSKAAKQILGAAAAGLAIPIPGAAAVTFAVPLAIAELRLQLSKIRRPVPAMAKRTYSEELTPEQIDKLGKQFIKDCQAQILSKEDMEEADVVRVVQQVLDNSDMGAWVRSKMAEEGKGAEEEPALNERDEKDMTVVSEDEDKDMPEKDEEMEPHKLRLERDQARRQLAKFQREVEDTKATVEAFAKKFQRAENEKELLKLEGEGVQFDLAEELKELEALDAKASQRHLNAMRKNYQRSPVGLHMKVAAPKERGDEYVFGPAEQARALDMVRSREVNDYATAVNKIKGVL